MVNGAAVNVRSLPRNRPWKETTRPENSMVATICGAVLGTIEPRTMKNRRQAEGRVRMIKVVSCIPPHALGAARGALRHQSASAQLAAAIAPRVFENGLRSAHELSSSEPRLDHTKVVDPDHARALAGLIRRPEMSGVESDQKHLAIKSGVKNLDSTLELDLGRRAPPRSFREDEHRTPARNGCTALIHHLTNGLRSVLAVNQDHWRMTQKPGKDRELEELALGNDRDIRSESQEGQGLPRGLVVCDNQARSDRDILLSLLD